ncbi:MAG: hypothetical protein JXR48_02490 [Candidatus Delongbacteria bacterium]|nr:hypothetical protein [Candidatus Delongbacteria bacterium]MBN2833815.1 hypothetical protein [Candidatus Delongbacteria bacterium]
MKLVVLIASIAILMSCSKKNYSLSESNGVKIYQNKNIVIDSTFTYEFTELFTISDKSADNFSFEGNYSNPNYIKVDNMNNLYLIDYKQMSIFKFDSQGQYCLNFGKKGQGPGEFNNGANISFYRDTLFVTDFDWISKFDFDGYYYYRKSLTNNFPREFYEFGKSIFSIHHANGFHMTKEQKMLKVVIKRNVTVLDTLFKLKKDIVKNEIEKSNIESSGDAMELNKNIFAFSEDRFYLAEVSKDKYEINAYDENGDLKEKLLRSYMKVPYKNESTNEDANQETRYKLSISKLDVDKYKNLLVRTPSEDNSEIYDIYKDNILYAKVKLENFLFFKNDRAYFYDSETNELKVYTYTISPKLNN